MPTTKYFKVSVKPFQRLGGVRGGSLGHQFFLVFLSITGNCAVREYFFCAISEGKRRVFWEGRSWAFFFGLSVTVAEFSVIGSVLADLAGLAGLA